MIYPTHFEEKIEFRKIRELLKENCVSTMGIEHVEKIQFLTDDVLIRKLLQQTAEFKDILQAGLPFPTTHYIDINPYIEKATVLGSFLLEEEWWDIKLFLVTSALSVDFFNSDRGETYVELKKISEQVQVDKTLAKRIGDVIDERGKMYDHASPELKEIRKKLSSKQSSIRKQLDQILRQLKENESCPADSSITIRNGRMVIPVLAEYKRKVKGFIHDESATGQTVYIEPAEILDINNEIKELDYEERREVVKILTRLTDEIRPFLPTLKKAVRFLGIIDFIRAKALLTIRIKGHVPHVSKESVIDWRQAIHPILRLVHDKQKKSVVPLTIQLQGNSRILLISGPNAGGKSVCLKTVGLLQYMLQCGIPIPVDEGSRAGIVENLFIDIGDQQSLENDLSTYSSHLTNMNYFLKHSNQRTLILIDEFGTGTDPQFGGAIAEGILNELNRTQAIGVITTHYTNLKIVAEKTPGLSNGAMLFDSQTMEPTYVLEMGKPGSSFALEIASKIGLPASVIQYSKQKIGSVQVDLDKLLQKIENEKIVLIEQNKKLREKEDELKRLIKTYDERYEELENKKKVILNEAKTKASDLLKEANRKIEYVIRKIKEKKAEKESTQHLRKEIQEFSNQLKVDIISSDKKENSDDLDFGQPISIGDTVQLIESDAIGKVIALQGKKAIVVIGHVKSTVSIKRLKKIKPISEDTTSLFLKANTHQLSIQKKMTVFRPELDIRGKMPSEAMAELEVFIDDAILANAHRLSIIHGKGTGVLRKMVRDYLKKITYIKSVEDDDPDRGGAGVTIVHLN